MTLTPRAVTADDLPGLKSVLAGVDLFPPDMLDGMIAGYLGGGDDDDQIWLTQTEGETPVSLAYCAPETMARGTMNLFLIAVRPDRQNRGHGTAMMGDLERRLTAAQARVLLVETSGLPAFERTRRFYDGLGFEREARIRDFYAAGEDKIVFRKALTTGTPQ